MTLLVNIAALLFEIARRVEARNYLLALRDAVRCGQGGGAAKEADSSDGKSRDRGLHVDDD